MFATWFGAESCIAAAGAVYERGLAGGRADPFGYGPCLLVMGALLAVPLWRLRLTTLGDLFRRRYSASVERLAVVLMVPASVFWAAAQIRAFGQVLSAASGIDIGIAVASASAVVVAYAVVGGLLADAWTDVVQGVTLVVGLAVLAVIVLADVGTVSLAAIEPARLRLSGEDGSLLALVEAWAIPIVGSVTAAELVARVIAARSPTVARRSTLAASGAYLALGLIPVTIGLLGPSLAPGVAEPEQILPLVAERYLPPVLYVLFTGALVSAILSTVDSALLTAAGLVSHNLVVTARPGISERAKVVLARSAVAGLGLVAYLMAARAERVYDLVEQASAFGSAGIVIVVGFGLFTRRGGPATALATLATGVSVWVWGAYVGELPYPYLTSLAAALGVYVAGAAIEGRRPASG